MLFRTMDAKQRRAARAQWGARVFRADEAQAMEAADAAFWATIPVDERAGVAWQLSLEQWTLAEPGVDHERRLPRSALRVERR
jgi:hypothetical protein